MWMTIYMLCLSACSTKDSLHVPRKDTLIVKQAYFSKKDTMGAYPAKPPIRIGFHTPLPDAQVRNWVSFAGRNGRWKRKQACRFASGWGHSNTLTGSKAKENNAAVNRLRHNDSAADHGSTRRQPPC